MSSSKPLLVYWDCRAMAEPIRLLLRYLEVEFQDRKLPFGELGPSGLETWASQRNDHGLDFPNIPFYVDDDVKITQSMAILQHIGRKYNIDGDTLHEKAVASMIVQTVQDLRFSAAAVFINSKFHEIKEEWKKTIPWRLSEFNKFMEGKKFILGDKISYADFVLYEGIEWFRQFAMDIFEESPELQNLQQFQKRIEALPQIKKYQESDDFKEWPFFAPVMHWGASKDPDFKPLPANFSSAIAKFPLD